MRENDYKKWVDKNKVVLLGGAAIALVGCYVIPTVIPLVASVGSAYYIYTNATRLKKGYDWAQTVRGYLLSKLGESPEH